MSFLLISSSYVADKKYLEHADQAVKQFLSTLPEGEILFIPYATTEKHWGNYLADVQKYFDDLGQPFRSIHTCEDPVSYIKSTKIKAIFTGGGNSFLLIKALQDKGLIQPIRDVVNSGTGYMGTSAGSNIACPTIQTTNDMPIVQPRDFNALNLVNFQINPHFLSGTQSKNHRGETREQRIAEYHEVNDTLVIGLPEPSWILVENGVPKLDGGDNALIFEQGQEIRSWLVGTQLDA